jgi:hypothetical protein
LSGARQGQRRHQRDRAARPCDDDADRLSHDRPRARPDQRRADRRRRGRGQHQRRGSADLQGAGAVRRPAPARCLRRRASELPDHLLLRELLRPAADAVAGGAGNPDALPAAAGVTPRAGTRSRPRSAPRRWLRAARAGPT